MLDSTQYEFVLQFSIDRFPESRTCNNYIALSEIELQKRSCIHNMAVSTEILTKLNLFVVCAVDFTVTQVTLTPMRSVQPVIHVNDRHHSGVLRMNWRACPRTVTAPENAERRAI